MLYAAVTYLLTGIAAEPVPDVVVVCPTVFRGTMDPWIAYRQQQGRTVAIIDAARTPDDIKSRLHDYYRLNPKLSVLLVGDSEPSCAYNPAVRSRCVPAHMAEAKVNTAFGSEPQIATDNWYVDFDGDDLPDAPVGRLPVDSALELARLVRRIIDYEHSTDFGRWRRRINFIAGLGNFGVIADTALENAAKSLLTRYLPPAYESTMTHASWESPYCPGLPLFQLATLRRFNEGCLMWVYMGHGLPREVDRIETGEGTFPILRASDVAKLQAKQHPPLAVFLSCYSGAYDAGQDCLAEEMLRADGGPIAVLCGTRVTMPYAMAVLGQELMTSFFHERHATLGEVLCHAKRATLSKPRDGLEARQFDAIAVTLMPMHADLKAQRREHLHLFNLLGDPLMRMPQPEIVSLEAPRNSTAGDTMAISGNTPIGGRAVVEFVVRRDRFTFAPPERKGYDPTPTGLTECTDTYTLANDSRLAAETVELSPGKFSLSLKVPAEAYGECHVRVFVEGTDDFALGSADVKVRSAPRTK